MTTIVTRAGKGTPLTNTEVDTNFTNLNTDKLELGGTFSSGTANSVLYLNGSKVLTTGSALTFDGTTLATTGGINSDNTSTLAKTAGQSLVVGNLAASGAKLDVQTASGTAATFRLFQNGISNFVLSVPANTDALTFLQYGSSELMRLTSTGLGIGTNNPAYKLDVAGSGASTLFRINNATTGKAAMAFANNGTVAGAVALSGWWEGDSSTDMSLIAETGYGLRFYTNGSPTEKGVIDTSGNLGLGVTPSAWESGWPALQVGTGAAVWSTSDGRTSLGSNIFVGSGPTAKYIGNGFASSYTQLNGVHSWSTAPNNTSGAGASLSPIQAMTLLANGNLGIGETNPGTKLVVATSTSTVSQIAIDNNSYATGQTIGIDFTVAGGSKQAFTRAVVENGTTAATALTFGTATGGNNATERARITSGGTFQTSLDASIYGVTVGRGAGAVATNTAVGASALAGNTTGSNNTAIGYEAALSTTTGTDNASFGLYALRSNTTGASNVAVGRSALQSNTTASNNTAVGYQAGYSNTTGTGLAAFGRQVLYYNTTGNYNSAFGGSDAGGASPLAYNTTGSSNTAMGSGALFSNTTASNNTAVGYQAGYSNTSGAFNLFVGRLAGYSNTTASAVTAVGNGAAYANTTGTDTTGVGSNALVANTTGAYNTALGSQSLYNNTTASNNTAVGYQAGYANTTGTENFFGGYLAGAGLTTGRYATLVGSRAGNATITGDGNTAVGYYAYGSGSSGANNTALGVQALYLTTTASANTAVGYQAGYSNTTGDTMAAFGYWALKSNTTGRNTGIGGYALATNTTGTNNNAFGDSALYLNTTGSYNTAVGYSALLSNTTASYNTAVGMEAGYTNQTGANVTYIGRRAGYLATGNSNTFVGMSSGDAVTSGANNTIVGRYTGNNGGLDIRTASNYIVLSDGDGNPRMYANGAAWTNPGSMSVGGINTYASQSQSFSLGTTQWIRLCQLGNPGTMRIKYFLGSSNSEEYGEVLINARYNASGNQITVNRQSYNSHLLEVRLVSSGGGLPYNVFFSIRSDQFAPSITWTPFDVRAGSFTIYNDTTSPGAASSSLVLETGSGTSSNIVATNGLYGAYGGGVQFPATQSASSNANTLDDYEEGTFTPVITGSSSGTFDGYGQYVKIGKSVTVQCQFEGVQSSSVSGAISITSMPFTIADSTTPNTDLYFGGVACYGINLSGGQPYLFANGNSTTFELYSTQNDGTASTVVTNAVFSATANNSYLRFSITYIST